MTLLEEPPQQQNAGIAPDGRWVKGFRPLGAAPTFKPGVSGNPGGRFKKGMADLSRLLDKYIAEHPEEVEAIIEGIVTRAKDDDKAANTFFDRAQGKPKQDVSIKHEGIGKIVQLEDEDAEEGS